MHTQIIRNLVEHCATSNVGDKIVHFFAEQRHCETQPEKFFLCLSVKTKVCNYETRQIIESLDGFKLDPDRPSGWKLNLFVLHKVLKGKTNMNK
jgi:hypothetical protein